MTPKHFVFTSRGLDGGVHLLELRGRERVSHLFELSLDVEPVSDPRLVEDGLDRLLAERASVGREGEEPLLHGMISAVAVLEAPAGGVPRYRLTFVPRLFRATLTRRSRIFQDMTVPAIVLSVLGDLGLHADDCELRLVGEHAERNYTVQYEETDFAFISRLLESEGIFYFFDCSGDVDKIVFADANSAARELPAHQGVACGEGTTGEEHGLVHLHRTVRVVPARVTLVDYNWRTPAIPLSEDGVVAGGTIGSEATGEEHYRDEEAGKRLAKLRAEAVAARRVTYDGASNIATLRAGDLLGVEDDRHLFVAEVSHEVTQQFRVQAEPAKAYANTFVAVDAATPFRPALETPRPRIDGCTYAVVDGEKDGAAAPIDDQGRYKVVFPFNRALAGSGRATRWIRMAQPLSGASYGVHFPLRVGAEVILSYVHGDPDRPIIVGAVPNAVTPSPVVRKNATQSVIQTSSGLRVELEDDAANAGGAQTGSAPA